MPPGNYAKPPIAEAVIELGFGSSVAVESFDKVQRALATEYPNANKTEEFQFNFDELVKATDLRKGVARRLVGYRFTSRDETELLIVTANKLTAVRLAPYSGWDALVERTKTAYGVLKKIYGYRKFERVSTRYINRIDIPKEKRASLTMEEYLQLEPNVPSAIPKLHSFEMTVNGAVPDIEAEVIIKAGTVNSPLIDHFSVLLDIDLVKTKGVPQKEEEIWAFLSIMRANKDVIFESFLTDKTRELFDRA